MIDWCDVGLLKIYTADATRRSERWIRYVDRWIFWLRSSSTRKKEGGIAVDRSMCEWVSEMESVKEIEKGKIEGVKEFSFSWRLWSVICKILIRYNSPSFHTSLLYGIIIFSSDRSSSSSSLFFTLKKKLWWWMMTTNPNRVNDKTLKVPVHALTENHIRYQKINWIQTGA